MHDYEKLGVFYLGRELESLGGSTAAAPLLYDSKDLTTHAVCVGMTGSGKTGLCLALIEEAAMDGIPVIAVDPKGDLGNLLLQFPDMRAQDFEPWVEPAEAARKGQDVATFAAATAATWQKGLAAWDQDGDRIRRLQAQCDFRIYSPGSSAGRPLSLLRSFQAPPENLRADPELLAERVDASVSGLLALLGIVADPLQSREHILLANILRHAWERGESLDLPGLLGALQSPPFARVGFLDLDTFYPAKDRMALVLRLNNLLASPGFQVWMQGDPLDVASLLHAPDGKPRVSVLSIAHLGENERMFFVTLLLNEIVAWMRAQPGTSSLRALFYMDEIFGYFPPSANPPSKKPMLTLLKQARAYGLGCVLATQNPVDLDYKGLANTGTWFIGRLQTERDKLRVLDGLEGASAGHAFDRAAIEKTLSALGNRRFLLHNVHDKGPVLFETRWVMSYLRGPLTRDQIRKLTPSETPPAPVAAPAPTPNPAPVPVPASAGSLAPPPGVPVAWLSPTRPGPLRGYAPCLLFKAKLHYVRAAGAIDLWEEPLFSVPMEESPKALRWEELEKQADETALSESPLAGVPCDPLPAAATVPKSYGLWEREAKQVLFEQCPLVLQRCPALKLQSEVGESVSAFRTRADLAFREERDAEVQALKNRYESRFTTLRNRIRRSEDTLERREAVHKERKMSSAVNFGSSLLGALLGRKAVSATNVRRAGSVLNSAGRLGKSKEDIQRAEDEYAALQEEYATLETRFSEEMTALETTYAREALVIEEVRIPARKTDLRVTYIGLGWMPT